MDKNVLDLVSKIVKGEDILNTYSIMIERFIKSNLLNEAIWLVSEVWQSSGDKVRLSINKEVFVSTMISIDLSKEVIEEYKLKLDSIVTHRYDISRKKTPFEVVSTKYSLIICLVLALIRTREFSEIEIMLPSLKDLKQEVKKCIGIGGQINWQEVNFIKSNDKSLSRLLSQIVHSKEINQFAIELDRDNIVAYQNILGSDLQNKNYAEVMAFYNNEYCERFKKVKVNDIIELVKEFSANYHYNGLYLNSIMLQQQIVDMIIEDNFIEECKLDVTPKISIIIPCYNAEKFVKRAIVSLKSQTFSDFEVIFVDDNSTDNTYSLLLESLKNDTRFKCIHLDENLGARNARNVALEYAKGEYVIYLDIDDIYSNFLLEETLSIAKINDVDIVYFKSLCYDESVGKYYNNDIPWLWREPFPRNKVFSPKDVKSNVFRFCSGVPWNKLYKKEMLLREGLKFQNLKRHNDTYFALSSQVIANKMYVLDKRLICYRINQKNSISSQVDDIKYKAEISVGLAEFLKSKGLYEEYKEEFLSLVKDFENGLV